MTNESPASFFELIELKNKGTWTIKFRLDKDTLQSIFFDYSVKFFANPQKLENTIAVLESEKREITNTPSLLSDDDKKKTNELSKRICELTDMKIDMEKQEPISVKGKLKGVGVSGIYTTIELDLPFPNINELSLIAETPEQYKIQLNEIV